MCQFSEIRADLRVLEWGQSVTLAAVVAVLLKLFVH